MVLLLNISSSYALRLTRASFTMAYSESHPRIMWPDQTGFCQVCFHRYIASLSKDTALFTIIHQVKMFRAHCSFFALGKIKNWLLPSRSPHVAQRPYTVDPPVRFSALRKPHFWMSTGGSWTSGFQTAVCFWILNDLIELWKIDGLIFTSVSMRNMFYFPRAEL